LHTITCVEIRVTHTHPTLLSRHNNMTRLATQHAVKHVPHRQQRHCGVTLACSCAHEPKSVSRAWLRRRVGAEKRHVKNNGERHARSVKAGMGDTLQLHMVLPMAGTAA
jgi:hypothetical protein